MGVVLAIPAPKVVAAVAVAAIVVVAVAVVAIAVAQVLATAYGAPIVLTLACPIGM